jgi:cytochrome c553
VDSPSKLPTGAGAITKVGTGKRSKKKQCKESARPSASEDKSSVRACFGCGEIGHAIKDCPKVDDAQKKTILAAKYKEWRQDKKSTDPMKQLARMQPDSAMRELYDVMFGNTVHNLSCIADTGADVSVLSETFVNRVKNSPSVRYEPLASPLELQLLGEVDNRPMAFVQITWATMPILVRLHCGPLRVPDWRFAVVRGKLYPTKRIPHADSGT